MTPFLVPWPQISNIPIKSETRTPKPQTPALRPCVENPKPPNAFKPESWFFACEGLDSQGLQLVILFSRFFAQKYSGTADVT